MAVRLRTAEECFAAGWSDGAGDKPLTRKEIEQLASLHSPYLRPEAEASSDLIGTGSTARPSPRKRRASAPRC